MLTAAIAAAQVVMQRSCVANLLSLPWQPPQLKRRQVPAGQHNIGQSIPVLSLWGHIMYRTYVVRVILEYVVGVRGPVLQRAPGLADHCYNSTKVTYCTQKRAKHITKPLTLSNTLIQLL
jgi:hypothetical protein